MNNPPHSNPTSLKSRFTTRFLRALTRINAGKPVSASSPREVFSRYRRIKVAADKSMAYSVRSRRTWSRAMVWKLRTRSYRSVRRVKRRTNVSHIVNNTSHETVEEGGLVVDQAGELRELVPGGEAMDLCNLLDETAHYIKCLTTQVQVMRKIVDFYSV